MTLENKYPGAKGREARKACEKRPGTGLNVSLNAKHCRKIPVMEA
jgi:hypothetical protein